MRERLFPWLVCLGVVAWPAAAFGLDVTPSSGSQGTAIQVQGFEGQPAPAAAVILSSPSGDGAVVDVGPPEALGVAGVIGPVSSDFVGELEVWWGQRFELPDTLVQGVSAQGAGLAYLTRSPSWFAASQKEPGTALITVESASPSTWSGALSATQTMHIRPVLWPILEGDTTVRVDIMIQGGMDPGADDDEAPDGPEDVSSVPPFFLLGTLETQVIPVGRGSAGTSVTGAQLAEDLARVLNTTWGALGVVAANDGEWLRISFSDPAAHRGFVNIQVCPSSCG